MSRLNAQKGKSTFSSDHRSGKGGIFGKAERSLRFADDLLPNGETFLRREENGRNDVEMFLGHTDCFLDEEDYNLENGEHFLKDCENNLARAEDFLEASETFLRRSDHFLCVGDIYWRDAEDVRKH